MGLEVKGDKRSQVSRGNHQYVSRSLSARTARTVPLISLQVSKKPKKKHPSKGPKRSKFHKQTPAIEYKCHQISISWDESDLDVEALKVFEDEIRTKTFWNPLLAKVQLLPER